MSEKNPTSTLQSTVQPEITKQTEGPLLLEIKAAVEKLSGDVHSLTERMNKADEEKQKKPEDKYPPAPCKSCEEEKAKPEPYPKKKSDEEKAKKPEEEEPKKKEDLELSEEEKAKKPEEPKLPKKQDEHGCSAEEEWDEASGKCVPKTAKAKKPGEYPYPEEPKKSVDLVQEQFKNLENQVAVIAKSLGIPAMKRTEVITKDMLNAPVDVSAMTWPQIHELARPIDLKRGA